MASYKAYQQKFLEKQLDRIVFIELKSDSHIQVGTMMLDPEIPLPVSVEDLASNIKSQSYEQIPPVALIKGIVIYLGVGKDEKTFTPYYGKLIQALDVNVLGLILNDAVLYAENEAYELAIMYFNAVLAIDPINLDALFNIGRCYMDLSFKKESEELQRMAKVYFEKTVDDHPNFYDAYYHLGFCYYNEASFLKAEAAWRKALGGDISVDRRSEIVEAMGRVRDKALFENGRNLILAQRLEEGLELLKTLEEDHDDWWELNFFIGVAYRMKELYDDAIPYFLKVLTLNTGHVQSMNEVGICFLSVGDFKMARSYFEEAHRIAPNSSEFIVNIGIVDFTIGEIDAARAWFNQALEINSNDDVAKMWLNHLNSQLN